MAKKYIRRNELVYDNAADYYRGKRLKSQQLAEQVVRPFKNYLDSHFVCPSVLEIGPGAGLMLKIFEESQYKTTAIDVSQKMLDVAKEIAPGTQLIHGDFVTQEFDNIKFEGIFARAVIHLFPRPDAVLFLKKIKHLLKFEGCAHVCTDLHSNSSEGYFEKKGIQGRRFRRFWSERDLLNAVSESGLEINSSTSYNGSKGEQGINLLLT